MNHNWMRNSPPWRPVMRNGQKANQRSRNSPGSVQLEASRIHPTINQQVRYRHRPTLDNQTGDLALHPQPILHTDIDPDTILHCIALLCFCFLCVFEVVWGNATLDLQGTKVDTGSDRPPKIGAFRLCRAGWHAECTRASGEEGLDIL